MTEVAERGVLGARKLVLGFDAGCMTCSELAHKIEEQVGDELEVRSLYDPQMVHWRNQALGEDAPWAPTLVKVNGGEIKAWTGLKMGLVLSRRLGPVGTWRVMQVLGDMDSAQKSSVVPSSGLSRGQFLKGIGGAAAAASILASTGGLASVAEATEEKVSATASHKFDQAVSTMEKYMRVTKSGSLALDEQKLKQAMASGAVPRIEPRIYRRLRRSLKKTNNQIQAGRLKAAEIFPSEAAAVTSEPDSGDVAAFSQQRHCKGKSGRSFRWWGIRMWFNSCQTNRLIRYSGVNAGAAALCAAFGNIPCGVVAASLTILTVGWLQGVKSRSRIGAIRIDKSWGLKPPRIKPQRPYRH